MSDELSVVIDPVVESRFGCEKLKQRAREVCMDYCYEEMPAFRFSDVGGSTVFFWFAPFFRSVYVTTEERARSYPVFNGGE
jgi:hypothetical protein